MATDSMKRHIYDEDGTCLICGFDGAEFHWWKHHTYEGKASQNVKEPDCISISYAKWQNISDSISFDEE